MRKTTPLLLLALLSSGICAPIDVDDAIDGAIEKRRDSTKETIQLEEALKRLSGENKKFYPPKDGSFQPQVDGLDDDPQVDDEQLAEDIEEINSELGADAEDSSYQDQQEEVDNGNQYADYGAPHYQELYPDHFGEDDMRLSPYATYEDTQYPAYRDMYQSYEPAQAIPNDSTDDNDFLLQNMFRVMQTHPELIDLLQQGQEKAKEEMFEDWDEDEEALDNLGGQPYQPIATSSEDDYNNVDGTIDEEHSITSDEDDPNYDQLDGQLNMQATDNSMDNLESSLQNKAIIKQLETLQELYGDKGEHTVAKKMSYMSTGDLSESRSMYDMSKGDSPMNDLYGLSHGEQYDSSSGDLETTNTPIFTDQHVNELGNSKVMDKDFRNMSIM